MGHRANVFGRNVGFVHIPVGFDKHGAIPQPGARIAPGRTRTRFLDLDRLHADNVLFDADRIHAVHSPPLAVEIPCLRQRLRQTDHLDRNDGRRLSFALAPQEPADIFHRFVIRRGAVYSLIHLGRRPVDGKYDLVETGVQNLLRYLVARSWDIQGAKGQLEATMAWRAERKIDEIAVAGDNNGLPVLYWTP